MLRVAEARHVVENYGLGLLVVGERDWHVIRDLKVQAVCGDDLPSLDEFQGGGCSFSSNVLFVFFHCREPPDHRYVCVFRTGIAGRHAGIIIKNQIFVNNNEKPSIDARSIKYTNLSSIDGVCPGGLVHRKPIQRIDTEQALCDREIIDVGRTGIRGRNLLPGTFEGTLMLHAARALQAQFDIVDHDRVDAFDLEVLAGMLVAVLKGQRDFAGCHLHNEILACEL